MVRVRFFKVRPERLGRLRAWMAALAQRDEEVRQTFRQETVRHELAYLIQGPDEPLLVYIIEAEDLEQAARAVQDNPLPIDLEHRQVMAEVLGDPVPAECLLNMTLDSPNQPTTGPRPAT
jgi:Family of unknown function (DUF6176)